MQFLVAYTKSLETVLHKNIVKVTQQHVHTIPIPITIPKLFYAQYRIQAKHAVCTRKIISNFSAPALAITSAFSSETPTHQRHIYTSQKSYLKHLSPSNLRSHPGSDHPNFKYNFFPPPPSNPESPWQSIIIHLTLYCLSTSKCSVLSHLCNSCQRSAVRERKQLPEFFVLCKNHFI